VVKRQKAWIYSPPKPPKPKVPETLKVEVERHDFNYIVDIYTKWYRNYFYFCAKYCCPSPNALSPSFEDKFARMEYIGGDGRFNLSFMRYTGQWIEIYTDLSLDESLAAITDDPWFHP
jgi:hypothetical protein